MWVSREARLMAWKAQVIQHEPNKKAVEVSSPPPPALWPPHHEGLSPVCPSLPSLVKLSVQNCTSSRPVPLIKRPVSSSSSAPRAGGLPVIQEVAAALPLSQCWATAGLQRSLPSWVARIKHEAPGAAGLPRPLWHAAGLPQIPARVSIFRLLASF